MTNNLIRDYVVNRLNDTLKQKDSSISSITYTNALNNTYFICESPLNEAALNLKTFIDVVNSTIVIPLPYNHTVAFYEALVEPANHVVERVALTYTQQTIEILIDVDPEGGMMTFYYSIREDT